MKKVLFWVIFAALFSICRGEDIKVLSVSSTGDITISATAEQAKPQGCWPFLQVVRYDIFKTIDGRDSFVARIVITQTFPTYSIGIITPRLDGSGMTPGPNEISKGMICRRTVKETLHSERKAYKARKKALKRQYKLAKIKAKAEVFESLDRTVQDANGIKSIEHKEVDGLKSESIKIEKK
ncbi:MAG: hypothetical protein WC496_05100 [Phycisphaerae bacterium]|jgi:hypothetical protein